MMVSRGDDALDDRVVVDRPALPHGARWIDDDTVEIDLLKPVTITWRNEGSETKEVVDRLTLHDLTGADMLAASGARGKSGTSATMVMFTRSMRIPGAKGETIVKSMNGRDWMRVNAVIGIFTDAGLPTGPSA